MLRKILLSTAFVAVTGTAFAADLPYRTSAPAPYVAAMPMFTWTGFYVGLNAGAAFNNNRSLTTTGFGAAPTIYSGGSGRDTGFTGGAQAGYNMQFGSIVAGIEADINYLQRGRGGAAAVPAGAPTSFGLPVNSTYYTVGAQSKGSNYFGTVRGRIGYAFDRVLIFATGGLAYGARTGTSTVDQTNVVYTPAAAGPPVVPAFYTATTTRLGSTGGNGSNIGYAIGGGIEYAYTNSISLKLEYLHAKLGNNSRTYAAIAPNGGSTISVRNDNKFDVVRAGVNFRF